MTRRRRRDASIFATQKHPPLPAAGDYTPRPLAFHGVQRGSHYGVTLRAYIKHQYYFQEVTQPLILRHLQELGINISVGELDKLLKDDAEPFHQEKDDILTTGLAISKYINTDDTGARHKGKNGYCTHIGNELFAWFKSTRSKSRLNFLQILSQEQPEYAFRAESFDYMVRSRLAPFVRNKIKKANKVFTNLEELTEFLQKEKITSERHITIILEAGLIGSILNRGLFQDTVVVSDDAGQFNVFKHALCWIHAERNIKKIITVNDSQAQDLKKVLDEVWDFYRKLKAYKLSPTEEQKNVLKKEFAVIFSQKTSCYALNKQLQKITKDQNELLLVLERPGLPLHNNLSEGDIREYVKRRKISAGTRSDEGQRCRDTFLSLKKTAKKLKVTFWEYLLDRIGKINKIPKLSALMLLAATA